MSSLDAVSAGLASSGLASSRLALDSASAWRSASAGAVTSGPSLRDPAAGAGREFAAMLGRLLGEGGPTTKEESREAAEMLLATTFVEPVLKSLRDNSQAVAPFAPTNGEKQMRSLLDQKLAQQIVHAGNWPLVDSLARDLLRTQAGDDADRGASSGDEPDGKASEGSEPVRNEPGVLRHGPSTPVGFKPGGAI